MLPLPTCLIRRVANGTCIQCLRLPRVVSGFAKRLCGIDGSLWRNLSNRNLARVGDCRPASGIHGPARRDGPTHRLRNYNIGSLIGPRLRVCWQRSGAARSGSTRTARADLTHKYCFESWPGMYERIRKETRNGQPVAKEVLRTFPCLSKLAHGPCAA